MGITQSYYGSMFSDSSVESQQNRSCDEDYYNTPSDENPFDNVSEDILIEILSHVPAEDLIFNCRLVCKEWRAVIDAQSVWRLKCERENVKLPTRKLPQLPNHHYRYIYFHSISEKNLIKNPCGHVRFEGWVLPKNRDRGFSIENPPAGSDPVPAEVGTQFCFVTTYYKCEKYQIINLFENAVHNYLLRHDLVKIRVGEWYAARFDCACQYELKVVLYNDREVVDQFEFQFTEEQWCGRKWHLVTHEFDNVTDVDFVGFYHEGKDRQFWAGHYGIKMTGAFVELCIK